MYLLALISANDSKSLKMKDSDAKFYKLNAISGCSGNRQLVWYAFEFRPFNFRPLTVRYILLAVINLVTLPCHVVDESLTMII